MTIIWTCNALIIEEGLKEPPSQAGAKICESAMSYKAGPG
jgi:hypothetical protein